MSKYYVDTCVIVARYKPRDPLHEHSEKFFALNAEFYASPATLLELQAVFSSVKRELVLPAPLPIDALAAFVVRDCNLKLVPKGYLVRRSVASQEVKVPFEYVVGSRFAERLRLRALDLVHVAYAWLLKRTAGVKALVTGDDEILRRSEVVEDVAGIRVLHPKAVIE